jgi:hypothetical protein
MLIVVSFLLTLSTSTMDPLDVVVAQKENQKKEAKGR